MTDICIGQKVTCVGIFKGAKMHEEKYPVKGVAYTVRGIIVHSGVVGLLLEEIINPVKLYKEGMSECAFDVENFLPEQYPSATTEVILRFPMTEEKSDVNIRELIQPIKKQR